MRLTITKNKNSETEKSKTVHINNFCGQCGGKLSENIMFCPKCGNKIQ